MIDPIVFYAVKAATKSIGTSMMVRGQVVVDNGHGQLLRCIRN